MADDDVDDFALVQQYRRAAIAAAASGDYAAAVLQAESALAVLSTIPSTATRGGGTSGGNQSVAFVSDGLHNLILLWQRHANASQGITRVNITRGNPAAGDGGGFANQQEAY